MNLKLFYSPPKWWAFVPPQESKQWDYENSDDYFNAWEAHEKAYAEAKANALEVGNVEILVHTEGSVLLPIGLFGLRSSTDVIDDKEYDWPGSAVVRDNKIYLSL